MATIDRRADADQLCRVLLLVRFPGNVRRRISTGLKIKKGDWLTSSRRVKDNDTANAIIRVHMEKIENWRRSVLLSDCNPTVEAFDQWVEAGAGDDTFNAFYDRMLKDDRTMVAVSARDQRQTLNILNDYNPALRFPDVGKVMVKGFYNHLAGAGYSVNTIKKHLKNLRKYVNLAIDHDKMEVSIGSHPFRNFRVKGKESDRTFLTDKELDKIYTAELSGRLDDVRRLFLFSCSTGLRFSDTQSGGILWTDAGIEYTAIKTSKTTSVIRVPWEVMIYPELVRNFKPVKITNAEVNRYLKTLMVDCEIDKLLTFHVARHTYLTHMARTTGNLFKVMKYAGLRKTETAMVYVHMAGI